jgi:hypothetical protein
VELVGHIEHAASLLCFFGTTTFSWQVRSVSANAMAGSGFCACDRISAADADAFADIEIDPSGAWDRALKPQDAFTIHPSSTAVGWFYNARATASLFASSRAGHCNTR